MFPAMVLLTRGALLEVVSILAPHVPERRPHRHLILLVVWILTFLAALHVMAKVALVVAVLLLPEVGSDWMVPQVEEVPLRLALTY